MQKLFPIILLALLTPALPAKAETTQAETCYNSLIQRPESRPDKATLALTVNHEDSQYHVVQESFNAPRVPDSLVYFRTNQAGECEELLSYQLGSHPAADVYDQRLGVEVSNKITEAFRKKR